MSRPSSAMPKSSVQPPDDRSRPALLVRNTRNPDVPRYLSSTLDVNQTCTNPASPPSTRRYNIPTCGGVAGALSVAAALPPCSVIDRHSAAHSHDWQEDGRPAPDLGPISPTDLLSTPPSEGLKKDDTPNASYSRPYQAIGSSFLP